MKINQCSLLKTMKICLILCLHCGLDNYMKKDCPAYKRSQENASKIFKQRNRQMKDLVNRRTCRRRDMFVLWS